MTTSFANVLLPFQFHNLPIRGRLLQLHGLSDHIPSLREATPCTQTLAELLAAAAMLAHDTKHSLSVGLQLQHAELGALIFAHCGTTPDSPATLKAYANPAAQGTPFETLATTEGGIFAITMEPADLSNRYQSLVPLSGTSAAESLAYYFEHSVQTPTLFVVFADTEQATALMLQALPTASDEEPMSEDEWNRMKLLLQTITPQEALDPSIEPETLLMRLFAEDDISTFDSEAPTFAADNPRARMLAALAGLPQEELAELISLGTVTLTDNTTGQTVSFTADELAHLLDVPATGN